MVGEAPRANEGQRRYWNTVAGPRWVAGQGFRERRNQEASSYCWHIWGSPVAKACSKSAVAPER
jgi:hypothetical protein